MFKGQTEIIYHDIYHEYQAPLGFDLTTLWLITLYVADLPGTTEFLKLLFENTCI